MLKKHASQKSILLMVKELVLKPLLSKSVLVRLMEIQLLLEPVLVSLQKLKVQFSNNLAILSSTLEVPFLQVATSSFLSDIL